MADLSARLEPFLLLARSTKGAAAAKIVLDATAAPGVYLFGELLDIAGIRELQSDQNLAKSYLLLQLFAYGQLSTYTSNTDSYPPLTPSHMVKLKHLTLVSFALQQRSIPYDDLLAALQLSSIRELEDMIIDVIYAGLLAGKMHHHERVLHIDWVAGRDVSPDDLPKVQARLEDWCTTAQNLLAALDQRISEARSASHQESAALAAYKAFRNDEFNHVEKEASEKKSGGMGGRGNWGGGGSIGQPLGVDDAMGGRGGEGWSSRRLGNKGSAMLGGGDDGPSGRARGNKRPRD